MSESSEGRALACLPHLGRGNEVGQAVRVSPRQRLPQLPNLPLQLAHTPGSGARLFPLALPALLLQLLHLHPQRAHLLLLLSQQRLVLLVPLQLPPRGVQLLPQVRHLLLMGLTLRHERRHPCLPTQTRGSAGEASASMLLLLQLVPCPVQLKVDVLVLLLQLHSGSGRGQQWWVAGADE